MFDMQAVIETKLLPGALKTAGAEILAMT